MAQVSMTVRMDSQLKKQFNELCNEIGMSVNTAINVFVNAVVKTRSIPFKISAYPTEDNVLRDFYEFRNQVAASERPELTMEEINEEIRLAREEMADRKKAAV
ncbi:MAG: type II toxin-antitoxin system RelB/DinJ family antitoxin [Prevotella sp.]|nr:type II toxin-antitoxin system RelB/DinJ family antitoxin [Prevotella sp.]MBR1462082.1 type II toxin-antitoxin system RelB/DinJ family antitoxin [Prevotella sp.]